MKRIRVLNDAVVDRIAAGEVVERPGSVVKELLDNALDAGARRIDVRVDDGGRRRIEVRDDGHGIAREDAALAFAQHATSKVDSIGDLDHIATLGFRGEALASIAAVARVELRSGTGEGAGVLVRVEGGDMAPLRSIACPRGTSVRVDDLFYNTPARRKHLKTRATEFGHVEGAVVDAALARPEVHLRLDHDGRTVVAAPPVDELVERVHQLLGDEAAAAWLPVAHRAGPVSIHGGITGPDHLRRGRGHLRWYVNGRPVSDYRLAHALVSAYDTLLDRGKYPAAALFLEMPLDEVDVNVHPRKEEVRFAAPGRLYGLVRTAVREALARHLPPTTIRAHSTPGAAGAAPPGRRTAAEGTASGSRDGGGTLFPGAADSRSGPDARPRHEGLPVGGWIVAEGTSPTRDAAPAGAATVPAERLDDGAPSAAGERAGGGGEGGGTATGIAGTRGAIRPLAQYANTYILAADADGLLIIDQHVAHERVLFEQILDRLRAEPAEAQHLLVPETLDLSAAEAEVVGEQHDLLVRLGFEVEAFGGDTWAIRTAPSILDGRRLGAAFRDLLSCLGEAAGDSLDEVRSRAAASLSCHGAVRAHQPLSREEMVRLVEDLSRCQAPSRCPHGRPVLLRVEHDEIERRLGRR